jgi:hypothetical protein
MTDDSDEKRMVRERVEAWAVVQERLDQERRESIRTADLPRFIQYFAGLTDAVNATNGLRPGSGLVEMQRMFRGSQQAWMNIGIS